jgi:hypothetical protein
MESNMKTLLAVTLFPFILGGCIAVGGNTSTPSKGQELVDLKNALDRGAITQAEYDSTKAQILSRR